MHELGGKKQLLIWHSDALEALNPTDGSVYWSVQIKPTYSMSISQPVVSGSRVFIMSFNRVSACIEVSEDGDSAKIAWRGFGYKFIAE